MGASGWLTPRHEPREWCALYATLQPHRPCGHRFSCFGFDSAVPASTAGPLDTPVLAQTTDRRLHAVTVGGGKRRTNLRCRDTRPLHDGREDFIGEHGTSNKAGAASIPAGRCSRLQIFQWMQRRPMPGHPISLANLRDTAHALYGRSWRHAIARDLHMPPRTVKGWCDDRPLPDLRRRASRGPMPTPRRRRCSHANTERHDLPCRRVRQRNGRRYLTPAIKRSVPFLYAARSGLRTSMPPSVRTSQTASFSFSTRRSSGATSQ